MKINKLLLRFLKDNREYTKFIKKLRKNKIKIEDWNPFGLYYRTTYSTKFTDFIDEKYSADIVDLFINFLTEHKCHYSYFHNLDIGEIKRTSLHFGVKCHRRHRMPEEGNLKDFISFLCPRDLIVSAFNWYRTTEGNRFWQELDNEWGTVLHKFKLDKITQYG